MTARKTPATLEEQIAAHYESIERLSARMDSLDSADRNRAVRTIENLRQQVRRLERQ